MTEISLNKLAQTVKNKGGLRENSKAKHHFRNLAIEVISGTNTPAAGAFPDNDFYSPSLVRKVL